MLSKVIVKHMPLKLLSFLEYINLSNYKGTKFFLQNINPELLEIVGKRRALNIFYECAKTIPAYQKFLRKHKIKMDDIKNIEDFKSLVPPTDKENYVSRHDFLDMCKKRGLPKAGLIVESSGSSGKPTNWLKAMEENKILLKEVKFEIEYMFQVSKNNYIVLSCWSLGPWTADLQFCYFFEHSGIVKNIGPNLQNVEETLKEFGPKYKYIIGGYPPFIKKMVDSIKVDWKKYHVEIVTGGEGFIKGWREYVLSKLKKGSKVYSSYGSSDLDTAIALETPLCVFIKEFLDKKPHLSKKLFNGDETPMIFQYDPSLHYIENTNTKGVPEFTITKLNSKIPNIMVKYNIHDRGGRMSYNKLITFLNKKSAGAGKEFAKYKNSSLKLPFLWVGGRSDSTISINGSNIHPQQVELALLSNKKVYKQINTFQISKKYESKQDVRFMVKIELAKGIKPSSQFRKVCAQLILKNLQKISRVFAVGLEEIPESFKPIVELYEFKTGPFSGQSIKNKYIGK